MSNPNYGGHGMIPADADAAQYDNTPLLCDHDRMETTEAEETFATEEGDRTFTVQEEYCPGCGAEYTRL